MYIEDIIYAALTSGIKFNMTDSSLMTSFFVQISTREGLTEKQSIITLRILKRYLNQLNKVLNYDFTNDIENPTYKYGIRIIDDKKVISIVNNYSDRRVIQVRFPYNQKILDLIRKNRENLNIVDWNKDIKSWIFSLDEISILFLSKLIKEFDFTCDDEFLSYVKQAEDIQSKFENYLPTLIKNNNNYQLINVSQYTPNLLTDDLIKALFESRKMGIFSWDDTIDSELNNLNLPDTVKEFLKKDPGKNFFINESNDLDSIKTIIAYMNPCLFIIPGGSEYEKIQISLEMLKSIGIKNSEISVLFRLPNDTDKEFNEFIKQNSLNSPISSCTRVVFISKKIPKTILHPGISFNCVVNFGFYNAHYSIQEFIDQHPNVIKVSNQKEIEFI